MSEHSHHSNRKIQRSRLFDLVRHQRVELHEAELITNDEYAWLCTAADEGKTGKGSIARNRLDEYDEIQAKLTAAIKRIEELEREQSDLRLTKGQE